MVKRLLAFLHTSTHKKISIHFFSDCGYVPTLYETCYHKETHLRRLLKTSTREYRFIGCSKTTNAQYLISQASPKFPYKVHLR